MKLEQYKKIIVLGNNGSGKSYFSKKLAKITNLPLIHLDLIFWRANWDYPRDDEWEEMQKKLVANDEWIIDGTHTRTMEIRFKEADLIFFLDIDKNLCLKSVKQRLNENRTDSPDFLEYTDDDNFKRFCERLLKFDEKRKPKILALHEKYNDKPFIVLKSRQEVDTFLLNNGYGK